MMERQAVRGVKVQKAVGRALTVTTAPVAVTVVFMGDSITFGQHIPPELRWTDCLADDLTRQYVGSPVNLLFANRGVSGQTTRQGLERFAADVQNMQPEVMTLQFGLNDCNYWVTDRGLPRVSEAAYRANLAEMIERAWRFGAQEVILMTSHPTLRQKVLLSGESYETGRKRYNDILRSVAEEMGVVLCDVEEHFLQHSISELSKYLLPYPDQLHLNEEGHEIYASVMKPYLEGALGNVLSALRNARDG